MANARWNRNAKGNYCMLTSKGMIIVSSDLVGAELDLNALKSTQILDKAVTAAQKSGDYKNLLRDDDGYNTIIGFASGWETAAHDSTIQSLRFQAETVDAAGVLEDIEYEEKGV